MEYKRTNIYYVTLIIISLLTSSWIKNYPPVPPIENYEETRIGNQVWMTHNLNVATFRNGDTIPQAKTKAEWQKANKKNNLPGAIIVTIAQMVPYTGSYTIGMQ